MQNAVILTKEERDWIQYSLWTTLLGGVQEPITGRTGPFTPGEIKFVGDLSVKLKI